MALRFYESPSHVTHDAGVAGRMAMKIDLATCFTERVKGMGLTGDEATARLGVTKSHAYKVVNGQIEKFTVDAMVGMLGRLGFRAR